MSVGPVDEDAKLIVLARAARARIGAREGAAIRDDTGRTYSGATVDLVSLQLSAVALAVANASASGSRAIEAAAVATAITAVPPEDVALLGEFGCSNIVTTQ